MACATLIFVFGQEAVEMAVNYFPSYEIHMLLRLCLAAVLGGIVGWERGSGDKPAGLRTHILVCSGSALFMLVSLYGFDKNGGGTAWDASRIAAQIVSGIGFLGAGTILHEGLTVKGLTTAASLWMIAAVGMAVGSGMITLGIFATILTMIILVSFRAWESRILGTHGQERRCLRVVAKNTPNTIVDLFSYFERHHVKVRTLSVKSNDQNESVEIEFYLKVSRQYNVDEIITGLKDIKEVVSFENVT